jgi:hypothetical protein
LWTSAIKVPTAESRQTSAAPRLEIVVVHNYKAIETNQRLTNSSDFHQNLKKSAFH